MSLYTLEPAFQNLLRPLANALTARGVSANPVTLFAGAGSIAVGVTVGYVKPYLLTRDATRIARSYVADPLIARPIAVNMFLDLHETARRIVAAAAITVPTPLLMSGADRVVRRGPQDRFRDRPGAAGKERVVLRGFYHDTIGTTN